jgi:hypothetical protein
MVFINNAAAGREVVCWVIICQIKALKNRTTPQETFSGNLAPLGQMLMHVHGRHTYFVHYPGNDGKFEGVAVNFCMSRVLNAIRRVVNSKREKINSCWLAQQ